MDDEAQERMHEDLDRLNQHVIQLMEHFDTVQIFVTRHGDLESSTASLASGRGNWFARYGQLREWVLKTEAQSCREEFGGDDEE